MSKRVSILDLTVAQIASIEEAMGVPVNKWDDAPKARLFPLVLAAHEGKQASDYDGLKMRELMDLVAFGEDAGKPEGGKATPASPA